MKGISEFISKLLRTSGERRSDETNLPCRRFSLAEIKTATNNFDDNLVIGYSSYGRVYKGFIDDRTISVAVKRFGSDKNLFRNEVLLLCQLHHPNLVRLIGYCFDKCEMIIVYEFMVNRNLGDHIYATERHEPLPWKQRLQICIGVARGLHYLHTGLKHCIFHRDVHRRNILLDEKWEAKLGAFELSKMGPPSLSKASFRMVTEVVGTSGFVDPEYFHVGGVLSDKSDVYSFGIVLLEVLCARKVLEASVEREEEMYLLDWAQKCKEEGTIYQIIDPHLTGKIAPECLNIYVDTATSCVQYEGKDRPTIVEVEVGLEHALELQEIADAASKDVDPVGDQKCTTSTDLSLDTTTPNNK